MKVTNHKNEVGIRIQFDESCSELVVNTEGVKAFVYAFKCLKVERGMEGVCQK